MTNALLAAALMMLAAEAKEEVVDLDSLDEKPAAAPTVAAPGAKEEIVDLDALAQVEDAPEYDVRPWLRGLPLLALLVVVWNVDWREARVKASIAEGRAARAPKRKA